MTFKGICIEVQGYDRHLDPKKDDANENDRTLPYLCLCY